MNPLLWVVALLVLGLGVMVLEVFVPSGGILGFVSIAALVAAVATAFLEQGPTAGIASLAVVLAGPVLWPQGVAGGVDWVALLLAALALVLLLGARWRVLSVIGAAALVGVGRWLWLGL